MSAVAYDTNTDWMAEGNCRLVKTASMFPDNARDVNAAKAVCSDCPARRTCLEYALEHRIDHGVWGGESERGRRRILKRRRDTTMR